MLYLFAGYPSLRFSTRHVFHLEFIQWWIAALWLQCIWTAAWRMRCNGIPALAELRAPLCRAAAVGVVALLLTLLPWQALKWYQDRQVKRLLAHYDDAPRIGLPISTADGMIVAGRGGRPAVPDFSEASQPSLCEVLAIEIAPGPEPLQLRIEFEADHEHYDFTRSLTVPPGETSTVYFPVYLTRDNRLLGVRVNETELERVQSMAVLRDVSDMPILPVAVLPEGWRDASLWMRFTR